MSINSYIAKQFAEPKGFGGNLVSFVMNRQNRPLYDEVVQLLLLSGFESVLDIGCGNGYVLDMLTRRSEAIFVGIDISADIIEVAKRRNRKHKKISFFRNDINDTSFADGSFDKAYTINTVYFWSDPKSVMNEIYRILKPNGIFINALYSNETLSRFSHTRFGYNRYSPQQLINAGGEAGFTVEAIPILQGRAICYIYRK